MKGPLLMFAGRSSYSFKEPALSFQLPAVQALVKRIGSSNTLVAIAVTQKV